MENLEEATVETGVSRLDPFALQVEVRSQINNITTKGLKHLFDSFVLLETSGSIPF
jgi:hypothetical protein